MYRSFKVLIVICLMLVQGIMFEKTAYAEEEVNLALNKSYIMSEAPDSKYSDSGSMESSDGILAYEYEAGKSYGYKIEAGKSKSLDITIDLGSITSVNNVKVHKWEGENNYCPDAVTVYASQNGIDYDIVGSSAVADGIWYNICFINTDARYIRVNYYKYNDGTFGNNWLFIDEIQVFRLNALSSSNLVLQKPYSLSERPYSSYSDSNYEATNGILAYEYTDGKSFGYSVPENEQKSVDVTFDFGTVKQLNNVKVHKWEGAQNYGADTITVYTSRDGIHYQECGASSFTIGKWYDISFPSTDTRYVKVNFSKYNDGSYGNDWLFIDEIEIFHQKSNQAQAHTAFVSCNAASDTKYICDGYADDIELQAAIDYISGIGGGTVEVDSGIYYPKKEIRLKDNIYLKMSEGTVIKLPDQLICALSDNYSKGSNTVYLQSASGYEVGMQVAFASSKSGYMEGSYSTITAVSGNALTIYPALDKDYPASSSYCMTHYGVIGVFAANNVKIAGGEIDGNKAGQKACIVNADSMFNGIASGDNCYGLCITGVYVHGMRFQGIHPWGNHSEMVIDACRCEDNDAGGIVLDTVHQRTICSNNICSNNGQSGLECVNSYNTVITKGSYDSNNYAGIELTNAYGNRNCFISYVNCSNNQVGIRVGYTEKTVIEHSILSNNSVNGVLINDSKYVSIASTSISNSITGINGAETDYSKQGTNTFSNCSVNVKLADVS